MNISCSGTVGLPLAEDKLLNYIHHFLKSLGYPEHQISLYFTDDGEIQELNCRYRGRDEPTDALAWSYWEEDPESIVLGDIVISIDRIKEQAQMNNLSEEQELIRILAHSCAHLVGYDHEKSLEEEKKMLTVEIAMLKDVGLPNIYS